MKSQIDNDFNETRCFNFSTLNERKNEVQRHNKWTKKPLNNNLKLYVTDRRKGAKRGKSSYSSYRNNSSKTQDFSSPNASPLIQNLSKVNMKPKVKHKIRVNCPMSNSFLKENPSENLHDYADTEGNTESPFRNRHKEAKDPISKENSDYCNRSINKDISGGKYSFLLLNSSYKI